MARGGERQGRPGQAYSNRTDLNQPVRTGPSQEYGERAALERQQQAMPLPQRRSVPPINRPTERPNEPVTAGLPVGPGPGPRMDTAVDPLDKLKAIYRAHPVEGIRRIIEYVERGGR